MKTFIGTLIIIGILAVGIWLLVRRPQEAIAPVIEKRAVPAIVLQKKGLGIVSFGASPEETIRAVTAALGTPTKDTGPIESFSQYGTCPGTTIRGVEWDNFYILFGDTVWGQNAFFQYGYTDTKDAPHIQSLATANGLTIGMSIDAIKEKYPAASIGEWLPGQKAFTLDKGASHDGQYLGGTTIDNRIYQLSGGVLCGE